MMSISAKFAVLSAACFSAMVLFGLTTSAESAVVGFYNFNENGGVTAFDTSGNGFNGTLLSSGTLPQWDNDSPSGDAGDTSLQFQGGAANTGSRVDIGTPAPLQLTGSRTISFWIKTDLTGFTPTRVSLLGKSYAQEGTFHVQDNGAIQYYYGDHPDPTQHNGAGSPSFSTFFSPAGVVTPGDWVHVVHTRDSGLSRQQYYINGVGLGSAAWTTDNPNSISTAPWLIGTGYDETFNGKMDSVGFFDQELTSAKIASMYKLDAQVNSTLRALGYNVPELDELWTIYDGGLGNSGVVNGQVWTHVNGIDPGAFVLGESWTEGNEIEGFQTYLLLGASTGLLMQTPGVPEPSSFLLLGLGMLGLIRRNGRRSQRS